MSVSSFDEALVWDPEFAKLPESLRTKIINHIRTQASENYQLMQRLAPAPTEEIDLRVELVTALARADEALALTGVFYQKHLLSENLRKNLQTKNSDLAQNAKLGEILLRFIDRLNDPSPNDPLTLVVVQLVAAVDAAMKETQTDRAAENAAWVAKNPFWPCDSAEQQAEFKEWKLLKRAAESGAIE